LTYSGAALNFAGSDTVMDDLAAALVPQERQATGPVFVEQDFIDEDGGGEGVRFRKTAKVQETDVIDPLMGDR
jgi:hypothetical protein